MIISRSTFPPSLCGVGGGREEERAGGNRKRKGGRERGREGRREGEDQITGKTLMPR
jgi:hypothetical protein